jgi:hypothetical protein
MSADLALNKIQKTIQECLLHEKRMDYALSKMQRGLPLTEESYGCLQEEQIQALDQFLYRFSKMQDAIGQRLYPAVLEFLEEPFKEMSFLDRLNRLEQLHVIESKENWLMLRNIRNSLAHEYEDDPLKMCQAINQVHQSYPLLIKFFEGVRNFMAEKIS